MIGEDNEPLQENLIHQENIEIDKLPSFHNIEDHKNISDILQNTMFGLTFLKGSENLNCISFVHKQKENVEKI